MKRVELIYCILFELFACLRKLNLQREPYLGSYSPQNNESPKKRN